MTTPNATPVDAMPVDIEQVLFRALHNEGDGGIWEHFDAENARTVAAALVPVVAALASRVGASEALDKFRDLHAGADMTNADGVRRVHISATALADFVTWLEHAASTPTSHYMETPR